MKITRKILCIALTAVMIVGCMSFSVFADETQADSKSGKGAFSDVGSTEVYSNAVKTLSLMGVINGYPDGTFKPNNNVTRAEFTAMLMRTLKLGEVGKTTTEDLPFSDVSESNSDISWAIPNINTAYGKRVINGYEDGTFRPSANVAYEEAIKMIVCTLGYGDDVDVSVEPWYSNFIAAANKTGITKTASRIGAPETPASRACIAQLLYDSLEVELIENGTKTTKTILSDYMGCVKCTGVISSNRVTSLSDPDVNLRENEIQIYAKEEDASYAETHTYATDDTTLNDYLGYEVEFYYVNDGSDVRTLLFCVVKDNKPVVINAKNIDERESSSGQIKYYENLDDDKLKTVNLESDNVVVYNGKLYGSNEAGSRFDTSMIPDVGELKFIDSNNNGRYDVVDITSYEVYYVSGKSSATYEISDNLVRDPADKTIKLDTASDVNLSIVNKSGADVNFSSIAVGNIVCVAKSNSGNGGEVLTKAIVLTDKVTGTVTAIDGDEKVTIAGKEYRYSDKAPWMNGASERLAEPQIQEGGTFYLDINGDIVAYSKNASTENLKYGYLMSYSVDKNSFDGDVTFRLLNSSGSEDYIGTAKGTRVDGTPHNTGEDVLNALLETAENQNTGTDRNAVQQVIKYSTKSSGGNLVFDKIITASYISRGAEVVSDKLTMYDPSVVSVNDSMTYNSTSKKLSYNRVEAGISNATIFVVPDDRSDYDGFRKGTVAATFKNGNSYNVEMFDISAGNVPKVVVAYGASSAQDVDSSSPIYVLEASEEADNSQHGLMHKFRGYKVSASNPTGTFDEWVSTDSTASVISDMAVGDVYRAGADRYGYSIIEDSNIIYKTGEKPKYGIVAETTGKTDPDMYEAEFVSIIGSVATLDDQTISVDCGTDGVKSFDINAFENAQVLIYDSTDKDMSIVKEDDYAGAISGLTSQDISQTPSEVLIYMSEGRIKLLCVLPR